jgi:hypothetical protein
MINIYNRNNITDILPPNSIGCELGVFEGEFSSILWNSNKFSKLYLVDIFAGKAYNFGKKYKDASVLENIVRSKFIDNDDIIINKIDSVSFLQSIPDKYFDFIYIDTTHSYETTKLELEESLRCVKPNGYICGHDYTNKYFPGVVHAVNEFCTKYGFIISVTQQEEQYPSFIIKNENTIS